MNYIKILEADLEKGYSKADLERLIGLPRNNLSGILKGDRKLSKKSELKIARWEASDKPNPLELLFEDMKQVTKADGKTAFFYEAKPDAKTISVAEITPLAGKPVMVNIKAKDHFQSKIPPMPKREEFEDSIDFAAAKNEWKREYGNI